MSNLDWQPAQVYGIPWGGNRGGCYRVGLRLHEPVLRVLGAQLLSLLQLLSHAGRQHDDARQFHHERYATHQPTKYCTHRDTDLWWVFLRVNGVQAVAVAFRQLRGCGFSSYSHGVFQRA